MMFNARSLRSKFDEFRCYVADEKPDVICITESWVSEEYFGDNLQDFEIEGYSLFTFDRGRSVKGGGVMLYVNSLYGAKELVDNDKNSDVESVWLDVSLEKDRNSRLRIGAFYRPGNLPHQRQMELDRTICDEIRRNFSKNCLILGDFNLKDFEHAVTGSPACRLYRKCLEEDLFMFQFVDMPTREGSLLDLVFSDISDLVQDLTVGETLGSSDHNIVRFRIRLDGHVKDNPTWVPNFSRADFNGLRTALGRINWEEALGGLNACSMWEKFKGLLSEVQGRFIPLKQRRKRKVLKPA